ncbi:hypothetical protein DAI22_10g129301 [Oryza sativa Japonica Group]|nr:hypothetical protein DAI22_10g129301 [Oryza sativa Japonica Group]
MIHQQNHPKIIFKTVLQHLLLLQFASITMERSWQLLQQMGMIHMIELHFHQSRELYFEAICMFYLIETLYLALGSDGKRLLVSIIGEILQHFLL